MKRTTIAATAAALTILALTGCEVPEDDTSSTGGNGGKGKGGSDFTTSQENAIEAAENYLDLSGFSRAGLIRQLSSKAGDGYSKADATFAVNHVKVDWKAEAVESAESYLELSSFSRSGLIQQLTSSAGDQYTKAQAEHAANAVGL